MEDNYYTYDDLRDLLWDVNNIDIIVPDGRGWHNFILEGYSLGYEILTDEGKTYHSVDDLPNEGGTEIDKFTVIVKYHQPFQPIGSHYVTREFAVIMDAWEGTIKVLAFTDDGENGSGYYNVTGGIFGPEGFVSKAPEYMDPHIKLINMFANLLYKTVHERIDE